MLCFAQYSSSSSRDLISQILHGATIFISGARALIPSSKRTWSFPLPVAPWQIATAPSFFAISTRIFAISGRAIAVPRRYLFSYVAFAFTHGAIYSSQNSSTTCSIYNLEAPQYFALSSRPSSSFPCPTSMQTQITS